MSKSNPVNIQHSLRKYLEDTTDVPAIWVYDGVEIPKEKPLITVEQLFNQTEGLSKGRQAVQTLFYYQVGIHAKTIMERHNLQDVLQRLFLFDKIPFIDAESGETDGHLRVESSSGTPIPAEDITDKTNYHRLYFDVTVDVVYGRDR